MVEISGCAADVDLVFGWGCCAVRFWSWLVGFVVFDFWSRVWVLLYDLPGCLT